MPAHVHTTCINYVPGSIEPLTTINSFNLRQPCEVGTVVILSLQVGKRRHREATNPDPRAGTSEPGLPPPGDTVIHHDDA